MATTSCTLSAERRVGMTYCEKCKSTNVIESENGNHCCNCGWDSTKKEYVKKQTIADKIRSMSDIEMSRELIPLIEEICEDGIPCEELFLQWLQSEAE